MVELPSALVCAVVATGDVIPAEAEGPLEVQPLANMSMTVIKPLPLRTLRSCHARSRRLFTASTFPGGSAHAVLPVPG